MTTASIREKIRVILINLVESKHDRTRKAGRMFQDQIEKAFRDLGCVFTFETVGDIVKYSLTFEDKKINSVHDKITGSTIFSISLEK